MKPVIVTNYSGCTDFCNDKNAFLVDFDYVKSSSNFSSIYKTSYYASPKVDSIIYNIKKVMSLTNAEILQFCKRAYNSIKMFTWENNAKLFISSYISSYNYTSNIPKVGVISNLSDNCGIGIYTQKLFKMDKNITFLIPTNEQCNYNNDNIIKCWHKHCENVKDMNILLKNILNLDVIIIQYHHGWYSWKLLAKLVEEIKKLNKIVLIEMHSLDNNTSDGIRFKYADRIMLHTLHDLNTLKINYNLENLLLFEHPLDIINKNIYLK